jgi:DNA-binding transcriptional LysR family regulator
MDIQLLKTFLEVKNTRHFGRAAENLYLTQAAVSARIKQLEGILGTALFTRYRNNLQLTTAGQRLISHAETMLISWERARADVSLKKDHTQVLSFGATSGLWDLVLQEALNEIHKNNPDIALRAESHGSDVLIRRLMERTLDMVLVYEPAKISELVSGQVAHSELVLVSTMSELTIETALNQGYVSVDWGTAFEINFAQFFKGTALPVLHTTLARVALEFILFHGGSAYLPLRIVNQYLNKELFQVEDAPVFNRPIFACYHKENKNTDLIENVLSIVETTANN